MDEIQNPDILKMLIEVQTGQIALSAKIDSVDAKMSYSNERFNEKAEALKESIDTKLANLLSVIEQGDRAVSTSVGMLITTIDRLEENQIEQGRRVRDMETKNAEIRQEVKITQRDIAEVQTLESRIRSLENTLLTMAKDEAEIKVDVISIRSDTKTYEPRLRSVEDQILSARSKIAVFASLSGVGGGGAVLGLLKAFGKA